MESTASLLDIIKLRNDKTIEMSSWILLLFEMRGIYYIITINWLYYIYICVFINTEWMIFSLTNMYTFEFMSLVNFLFILQISF